MTEFSATTLSPRWFIKVRPDDCLGTFYKRTIAAQLHFLGAAVCFVGVITLARVTVGHGIAHFWTTLIFGCTAMLLFMASATMHLLADGFHISPHLLRVLELIDKFSIYLLIAGTYTAVTINAVDAAGSWLILSLVWALAITGIFYTAFQDSLPRWARSRFVYTGQFVLLGWTALLKMDVIVQNLSGMQLTWLFLGGGSYSLGAVIYVLQRPNPWPHVGFHELWHALVLAGYSAFFVLILSFYL